MTDKVTSFTGPRTGPTPADRAEKEAWVEEMRELLGNPHVIGAAVVAITWKDGNHLIYPRWFKHPGCGKHELVGAVQLLLNDIVQDMPMEDENPDLGA